MGDLTTNTEEAYYHCEQCGKPLFPGDKVQLDSEGIAFCEEHAATLSDLIAYWEPDLAEDEENAGWPEFFDDPEEVRAKIEEWKARLAAGGDVKLLQEV
ncbi:hypothetical protein HOY34_17215 [Xinfangfangia sp. D13-10-4-6]|uniref:hypothetical protein n=1 Tax=Pseudogemmobacter hezensis TaxID=2737662 RepID=UPI0015538266|nr:hypothetical protein [Pseudogemmobacter hezensis]NPD16935.1 hypothetical protein [Pseudogemmobacter hezensis]